MKDHNAAIGQLLVAHEHDIQTLRLEIETLRSEVKRLRADLLASLKYAHLASYRAHPAPPPFPHRYHAVIHRKIKRLQILGNSRVAGY